MKKKKGVTAGRPRKTDENVKRVIIMYQSGNYSLAEIREKTGISKSTLYRYLENQITIRAFVKSSFSFI